MTRTCAQSIILSKDVVGFYDSTLEYLVRSVDAVVNNCNDKIGITLRYLPTLLNVDCIEVPASTYIITTMATYQREDSLVNDKELVATKVLRKFLSDIIT